MKYYIIAGEASGDLHGSNLIKHIRLADSNADLRMWGGDLMEKAGAHLVKHYRELAFMGFSEVIKNLPTILKNISFCKTDIETYQPDVLVLIDYPGFNLRIASWAKAKGIKVCYYISPQVWAWKENRVKKMKQCIDQMIVILPFEKEWYANKWNWDVVYTGHPLVTVIDNFKSTEPAFSNKPIIAVLPGSRKQEIAVKLPEMLKVSNDFPNHQFIVAMAPSIEDAYYERYLQPFKNVTSVKGKTYDLLAQAQAAIVTSGTATLETALFGVPEIVCYKGSNISYLIAKRLIKIKYISLVNLILDKPVVKELIQHDMNRSMISAELQKILNDPAYLQEMKDNLQQLHQLLEANGNPSGEAARLVVALAKNKAD
jgi:lipid-A-disaccharide synthase